MLLSSPFNKSLAIVLPFYSGKLQFPQPRQFDVQICDSISNSHRSLKYTELASNKGVAQFLHKMEDAISLSEDGRINKNIQFPLDRFSRNG
jgi:hypothetical protein